MTLRFVDSFDDRDGDYVDAKYFAYTLNWIGVGRTGANAATLRSSFQKWFMAEHGWTIGFALYYHVDQTGSFFAFWDILDQYQLSISTLAGGFLQVGSGAGVPIFGVSTAPLLFDTWQYIEIKIFCDSVNGSLEIRQNGIPIYTGLGIDTNPTGAGAITSLIFPDLTSSELMDDVYICDDNGSVNNDFLGDCHVECILPNGDGTPATAGWFDGDDIGFPSIYTQVNDYPPSGWGYNYVEVPLPAKDVWSYPDIAAEVNSILGIQVNCFADVEDDVSVIEMENICRSGGIDYESLHYTVPFDAWEFWYFMSVWEQNPDGPKDWTVADFNNAEFGYNRIVDPP